MDDKQLLDAIRQIVKDEARQVVHEEIDRVLDAKLEPVRAEQAATNRRLDKYQEDFGTLKEDSTEVRVGVNKLLEWVGEASIEVKVPLLRKAE